MSDMTLLANQYAASAEFLERVNAALLALKKAAFGREPDTPTANGLKKSREELAELVQAVHDRLGNPSANTALVPEELLERLNCEYGSQLSWHLENLERAVQALRSDDALSDEVFATLDEVCQAADAIASASFRRLWRR